MAEHTPSKHMTSGEVAELFGVNATTVSRWADEGRLPHFKTLAGQRRYLRADVERLLAEAQPPEPEVAAS